MLASLADLGYEVEWRVANAAEYGFPQKRRRVFIIGRLGRRDDSPKDQLLTSGVLARALPARERRVVRLGADRPRPRRQEGQRRVRPWSQEDARSAMPGSCGSGLTAWARPSGPPMSSRRTRAIGSCSPTSSKPTEDVPEQFFVGDEDLAKWQFLKGAKSLTRISRSTGMEYTYDEGPIPFPDPIDRAVADDPDRRGRGDAVAVQAPHPDRGRSISTTDAPRARATERVPRRLDGWDVRREARLHDGQRPRRRPRRASRRRSHRGRGEADVSRDGRPDRTGRLVVRGVAGLQLPNPPPTSPAVRNVMRANRARDTAPERSTAKGAPRRASRRLSPELEEGARPPGHRLPRPEGRGLRPRLLLAPLPALLPEPPEVEPRVLGAQVRAQPRAGCPQAPRPRGDRLGRRRGVGVRRPQSSGGRHPRDQDSSDSSASSCSTPNTASNGWQSSPFSSATARISSYRARIGVQSFKSSPTTTVGSWRPMPM